MALTGFHSCRAQAFPNHGPRAMLMAKAPTIRCQAEGRGQFVSRAVP